jgi:hypothetical protein
MQTTGERTRRVSQTSTGATAPASARSKRLDYLDALKVALITLVVAHHPGQPYGPTGGLWPVSNPEQAPVLGSFFTVNAAFFMGLFFLISAYFVPASFDRKGSATFLKGRFVRLGVPIAGFLLTVAVMVLVHDLVVGGGSMQGFLPAVASLALGEFHLAQLWFVDQLLVFVVLYAAWRLLTARWSIPSLPVPGNAAIIGYLVALAVVTFVVRIEYPVDRWVVLLGIMPAEVAHLPQYVSTFVIGLLAYRGRWLSEMPTRMGLQWLGIGVTAAALPRAIHQELLELLQGRLWQHLRHALGVLARQLGDQPEQVVGAVQDPSLPREHRSELLHERLERLARDLADDQLHACHSGQPACINRAKVVLASCC